MSELVLLGKKVFIKQIPAREGSGGLESLGRSTFPNTKHTFTIQSPNKKLLHGLSKEEQKAVENFFGVKLESDEGLKFYTELMLELPERDSTLDCSNPKALLTVKSALASKLIAPSDEEATNPNCKASYYISDTEKLEKLQVQETKEKSNMIVQVTNMLSENPKRLTELYQFLKLGTSPTEDVAFNAISKRLIEDKKFYVTFKEVLSKDEKFVKVSVLVDKLLSKNILRRNLTSYFENPISKTEYGKNHTEIVEFLMDVKNQDELGTEKGVKGYEKNKPYACYNLVD